MLAPECEPRSARHRRRQARRMGRGPLPLCPLRGRRVRLRAQHRPRASRGRGRNAESVCEADHPAIRKYEEREVPFGAWIMRVARNASLDHVRARRQVPVGEVRVSEPGDDQDGTERRESLIEALSDAARGAAKSPRPSPCGRALAGGDRRAAGQVRELDPRSAPSRARDAQGGAARAGGDPGHRGPSIRLTLGRSAQRSASDAAVPGAAIRPGSTSAR